MRKPPAECNIADVDWMSFLPLDCFAHSVQPDGLDIGIGRYAHDLVEAIPHLLANVFCPASGLHSAAKAELARAANRIGHAKQNRGFAIARRSGDVSRYTTNRQKAVDDVLDWRRRAAEKLSRMKNFHDCTPCSARREALLGRPRPRFTAASVVSPTFASGCGSEGAAESAMGRRASM